MRKNRIFKRIGAGLLSGLCAFSMLTGTLGGVISASAQGTSVENSAFPSSDKVIKKAASLLGAPYGFGFKGYSGVYYQGSYSPLSVDYINQQGIDCSGLIYYTMTQLGYKTSGFSWNNPVPVDTDHWLTVDSGCTITYDGETSTVDVEKINVKTKDHPYWECPDGSTITAGSVVIAQNPSGEDHSWIYMGEFDNRSEVVTYLKSIGVPENLISSKTVGDGNGDGGRHWRIESSGSEGVVINNKTDGKTATAMNMYAFRITKTDVEFNITKVLANDKSVKISGTSPIDNSKAVYGVYTDKGCTKKVGEITIDKNGNGSITLPEKQYYVKEISAPTGYSVSTDVFSLKVDENVFVTEDFSRGKISINKTAEDGIISGRKFKLTYTLNGKEKTKTATTNANGKASFSGLQVYDMSTGKAVSYNVSEINVDTRYEVPKAQNVILTSGDVDLSVNVKFDNKLKTGEIKINKQAEDGEVGDRTFVITGGGKSYTVKTAKDGIAIVSDIPVYDTNNEKIIYTISEKNVDIRYATPADQTATLVADATVTKTFNNVFKKGGIKINKQAEDGEVGNRTFEITGGGKTYTATTSENGVAEIDDIPVYDAENKKITYTVSEKNVPVKYVCPADQTTTLSVDLTTSLTFENVLKKFTAEVTKKDSETGSSQGNATLSGAVYGLFKDGELIEKYTTDENGFFKTKEYVCGNYTIKEISSSEGYLLDETEYPVGAEARKYTIQHNSISMGVTEDVIKGKISIIKHSDDGSTQIETPEVGAQFQVFLKSSESFENAKEAERDLLVCDENGYAETKDLPYGTYTVHQVSGWDNTELISDFDVTISENTKTYRYLINNAPFESYVKVVKVDSETGKAISYEGAGFEIYNAEGEKISMSFSYPTPTTADVFYTNSEGCLVTPQTLFAGEYTLVEVSAPYGYVLDRTPVKFTVNAEHSTQEDELTVVKVIKSDLAQKGRISVTKTGNIFQTVNISENSFTPVFASGNLSGAVYEISALEDIVTKDGTVRAKAGEVVSTITTDENGYAQSDLLYLGKYCVTEKTAPDGYVLNSTPRSAELTYAGQEIEVRDTVNTSFENEYQKVKISLSKVMEKDELFTIGENGEYKAVRFGLFSNEKLTASDGTSIPQDGLIEEISLSENMTAQFNTPIPFGKYYVQEIATDEHYVISGEKYLVNFTYQGQEISTVNIDCGEFTNILKRGSVRGIKVNESDEPLENALFGLFEQNETEYSADTALLTALSNENGCFSFEKIPYGEYVIREIKSPAGYILSDEIYPVSISENEQVVKLTAVNTPNVVSISKTDIYGNELKGAKMQMLNSEGKIFDEWVSDGTNHIVSNIPAGSYTLKEIASPVGYVIATDISFEIDEYGVVTVGKIESNAHDENGSPLIVMIDDTTKVSISKTDISGEKEVYGAKLQVIDKDKNIVDQWVSDVNAHEIYGVLCAGETYILHEESAPDGYVIASDIEFVVNADGSVTKVKMKDDTTKVEICKTDISGETELAGAALQILDSEGNIIDEWTSDGSCHKIYGLLIAGKEYTLHEVSAPAGYELAEDIRFTVSSDGSVDKVVMKDEKTPDTPETPSTPSEPGNPHTGMSRDNQCELYLAFVCLAISAGVAYNKRKNRKETDERNDFNDEN